MTDIAPLGYVLRQLAIAADAGLPPLYSCDVMPQDYDHIVDLHVRLGYDTDRINAAALIAAWRDWWISQGAADWTADSEGSHHHLRATWCGWQIVLTWLQWVEAVDMLPAEAVASHE